MVGFSTIVLAGGASARMGRPKALLPFGPETLIERIVRRFAAVSAEVIVVSGPHVRLPPLPREARIVEDETPLRGPLSGLAGGLHAAANETSFVCGCDHPFLEPALASFLVERCRATPGAAAVWARWDDSPQPLVAAYRKDLSEVVDDMLASGLRRLVDLRRARVIEITPRELAALDPWGRSFVDVDTPAAYERALALREHSRG
jgi:molybdopterin-guanine dinucleotide biosynthesis protein A